MNRVFGRPTKLLAGRERPADAYDPARRQHASGHILEWLVARPLSTARILAVTDADLFIPVLTFVYGEAQLGGRAAVVSTARLSGAAEPWDVRRLTARLAKESVHELGHTFGLLHCSPPCVMSRSVSLVQLDAKRSTPCDDCRARLREGTAPEGNDEPADEQENAHPDRG